MNGVISTHFRVQPRVLDLLDNWPRSSSMHRYGVHLPHLSDVSNVT